MTQRARRRRRAARRAARASAREANRAFFAAEAERLARLCHRMAERFARGGRLIALGALAGGALRRPPRRGRVRAPGDRRQAGAARDRARGRGRRRWRDQVDAARRARTTSRSPSAPTRTAARRPRRSRVARERGCLTIAFAPAGAEWEFEPPTRRPVRPPGAGRDALPRALGARARVLRPPRPARGPRRAAGRTTPARRASSTRSSPSSEDDLEAVVDDVRALGADEGGGGRRAARADARPRTATRCSRPRRRCAASFDAGGKLLALRQRRLGHRRDGRRRRLPRAAAGLAGARRRIDLTEDPAILTAIANDIGTEAIFARQVIAYGRDGRRAARALDQRQLGERDRGARRGAAPRAASRSRWSATTAAGSPPRGSPTTWSSPAPSTSRASRRRRRAPTTCCASWSSCAASVGARAAACAPASRARCRASASGPTSTGWRASSGWPASSSTTRAACWSRSRATSEARRARSSRGCAAEAPPLAQRRAGRCDELEPHRRARASRSRESAAGGEPRRARSRRTRATCADCLAELFDPARPPLPLPVHQLHQLRPALHDRARRPLRPAAHDDGRLRDVRALPGRVRRPARPPLPRPAERLPGLRAAAAARRPRRRGRLAGGDATPLEAAAARAARRARSSRSRASAASTSPAAPTTRRPWRALRARKHREDKPFALMAPTLEAARDAGRARRRRASSCCSRRARPIVLAPRRPDARRGAVGRARRSRELGVMLPYSPLHHLLLADAGAPLVMTSGNVSDEPIAYRRRGRAASGSPASPTCSSSTTGRSRRAPTTRCVRVVARRGRCSCAARAATCPARCALPRATAAGRCSPAAPS